MLRVLGALLSRSRPEAMWEFPKRRGPSLLGGPYTKDPTI